MTQEEYNELMARERLVVAVEDISNLLTATSSVDLAIRDKLDQANDNLVILSNNIKLMAKTAKTPTLSGNNGQLDSMVKLLSIIANNTKHINKSILESFKKGKAPDFSSTVALLGLIADDKQSKKFSKNISLYTRGLDAITHALTKLRMVSGEVKALNEFVTGVSTAIQTIGDAMKSISKHSIYLLGSMLATIASLALLPTPMLLKASIAIPIVCTSLALGMTILSKASEKVDGENILMFSLAIAGLSVSLMLFEYISWTSIAKGTVAIAVLATTLALATVILPRRKVAEFNRSILMFSASVGMLAMSMLLISVAAQYIDTKAIVKSIAIMTAMALILAITARIAGPASKQIGLSFTFIALSIAALGLSLVVFQELIQNVDFETFAIAGASMLGLALVVRTIGQTGPAILKGAMAMGIMVAAIYALPYAIRQWDGISMDMMLAPGIVIGSLTGALTLLGKNAAGALMGAGAILVAGSALLVMAKALNAWPDKSWEELGKIGVVVAGLVGAIALAGASSLMMLAGAAALIAGAFSLKLIARALHEMPNRTEQEYITFANGLMTIGGAMLYFGNPLFGPMILAGIALTGGLGHAVASAARGLNEAAKVDVNRATRAADSIVAWAKTTINKFKDTSITGMVKAMFGLQPMLKLGAALALIATSVNAMASGTYNEYAVKNGKTVLVAVHKVGPDEYKAVGKSIDLLIDSITDPLAKFGKGGGWFRDSDTEKGLKALSNIGSIVNPMIAVAKEAERIKQADYSGFGIAVDKLVTNVQQPLERLGKGSSWWRSNDAESGMKVMSDIGSIVTPMIEIAKNTKQIFATDYKRVGAQLNNLIWSIQSPLERVANTDIDDGIDKIKDLGKIVQPLNNLLEIGKNYKADNNLSVVIDTVVTSIAKYSKADAGLPITSKFSNQLAMLKRTFDGLNTSGNVELLVEAAHAIDSIANANLSKIRTAKQAVTEELFDLLKGIKSQLILINKNTMPKEISRDIRTDKDKLLATQLDSGDEVDLTTIALMLEQLISLTAGKR